MTTPPAAASVFGAELARAEQYHELLAGPGLEWGLIGPRERDRLWERHILNSVAVADAIPEGATVIDVGSGAGLPGVPLALARPDLRITLLEPLLRRATFLTMVVDTLELDDRVTVVRGRAEDHRGRFDVVTCRAVARLPKLLGWTSHLLGPGGVLVALKGESAAQEIEESARELARLRMRGVASTVRVHLDAEETWLLVVSRTS